MEGSGGDPARNTPTCGTRVACCAPAASGALSAPASEVSRKRRRSMSGWWGDSTVEVKYVAVASTAGDPRTALAVERDHRPLDAGVLTTNGV
jgi:hypothetical protein